MSFGIKIIDENIPDGERAVIIDSECPGRSQRCEGKSDRCSRELHGERVRMANLWQDDMLSKGFYIVA